MFECCCAQNEKQSVFSRIKLLLAVYANCAYNSCQYKGIRLGKFETDELI